MKKGQKHSDEAKLKASVSGKLRYSNGEIPWNKKPRKEIICACGCGRKFIDLDCNGKSRKFIHGHNKPWTGRKRSAETIEKMAASKRGVPHSLEQRLNRKLFARRGEANNKWKGGITPINEKIRKSFEYKLWREAVFKRDDYTCVLCYARGGNGKKIILNADHIKPFSLFPELRFSVDNGRTLCVDCHRKTDTYGTKALSYDVGTTIEKLR